jgi:hypothetical protein
MRLYERFAEKHYHTSLATTFGIDFDAYESIALSRLRGAGCRNNLVIADSRMLTHALGGASDLPRRAGTYYTISGAQSSGVFHPKLFLQLGRKRGRLIIGSANLTPSGLAGNLEIVSTLSCDETDAAAQQLIAQAWRFAARFADGTQQSVNDQIAWMRARTPWLDSVTPATGLVELNDGSRAALLLSGESEGIGRQFARLIDEPVSRLIVISPYWDPELVALSFLQDRLQPENVAVIVDKQTKEFPKEAAPRIDNLSLYDRGGFREGRFIHAKAIIAQTASADHVLFGSANCTTAALGGESFAGVNAEACLYRTLPAGYAIGALKLDTLLTDAQMIEPDELNEPDFANDLPLDALAARHPGTFEGRADTLIWRQPKIVSPQDCKITLLDQRGNPISCTLSALSSNNPHTARYQLGETPARPAFARITFPDGLVSAPAIISWIDTLKLEIRERRRSGLQSRLDELEGDTEASLALLEIMNELEAFERGENTPKAPISVPKSGAGTDADATENHKLLSYEEFIAGRRPRTSGHELAYNSLAGSDISIVRSILNRIINLNEAGQDQHDDGPSATDFDLGDETGDAEGDLEGGAEFGKKAPEPDAAEQERQARRKQQRRATQDQLVKAMQTFQSGIKERQEKGEALTNHDLVRLRALIMILATAASPHAHLRKKAKDDQSTLRVLPVEGDQNSWPLLIGRLLFTFFGGNKPAIRLLHTTDEHDQVPGDFNECWATCYWAFQACMNAPLSAKEKARIKGFLESIIQSAFIFTLPSKDELLGDDILAVMDRMNESYATGMSIDPNAILAGHRRTVEGVFTASHSETQPAL